MPQKPTPGIINGRSRKHDIFVAVGLLLAGLIILMYATDTRIILSARLTNEQPR